MAKKIATLVTGAPPERASVAQDGSSSSPAKDENRTAEHDLKARSGRAERPAVSDRAGAADTPASLRVEARLVTADVFDSSASAPGTLDLPPADPAPRTGCLPWLSVRMKAPMPSLGDPAWLAAKLRQPGSIEFVGSGEDLRIFVGPRARLEFDPTDRDGLFEGRTNRWYQVIRRELGLATELDMAEAFARARLAPALAKYGGDGAARILSRLSQPSLFSGFAIYTGKELESLPVRHPDGRTAPADVADQRKAIQEFKLAEQIFVSGPRHRSDVFARLTAAGLLEQRQIGGHRLDEAWPARQVTPEQVREALGGRSHAVIVAAVMTVLESARSRQTLERNARLDEATLKRIGQRCGLDVRDPLPLVHASWDGTLTRLNRHRILAAQNLGLWIQVLDSGNCESVQ